MDECNQLSTFLVILWIKTLTLRKTYCKLTNVPQTRGTKGMSFWRSNIKALWPFLSHFHCLLKWKKCSQHPMQKWELGAKQDMVSYLLISIHFLANFNCYIISINGLKIRDGLWERTSRISKILLIAYNYWSQKFIWGTYS